MRRELLTIIRCPACAAFPLACEAFDEDANGTITHGVVWCRTCHGWYPIEDAVLELLQSQIAYGEDRARFWTVHRPQLEDLGLMPFVGGGSHDHGGGGHDHGHDEAAEQRHQQQHFDWYSDNHLQTYAAFERMGFWQVVDRAVFSSWRQYIQPGRRLLDVGCAQGRSAFKVQAQAPDTTIVGFDVSKLLVAQAVARARGNPRMQFFVGDAVHMPIVDQSFDYVLIYGVLHHLPKPVNICREVARVLTDDGLFFCSENNLTAFRPLFDWLQRRRPAWYEEAGEHSQIHAFELEAWLRGAGFRPSIRSCVFLPPHILNVLPERLGRSALAFSDRVLTSIPWLKDQGGLLVSTSTRATPYAAPARPLASARSEG